MTENEVSAQVVAWLQERGWYPERRNVGMFWTAERFGKPFRVGTVGACDWIFAHPTLGYLEVEMKATGKQPSKAQREYMALRTHHGLKATWCDSLDAFSDWYEDHFVG